MEGGRSWFEERTEMREELIKKAYELSMKAHDNKHSKHYLYEKSSSRSPSEAAVFAFAGSWSANDWFSRKPFGETKIDLNLFPSLRSIGNEEAALVNEAFLLKFKAILQKPLLDEVNKAVGEKRQVVFTGHSSGGALAMLTTLWFLEKYTRKDANTSPRCVTFGSPLIGDRIFPHAIRREKWSNFFLHFVMKHDIVPLIMLAPLSSIEQELPRILDFFNPKSKLYKQAAVSSSREASSFYTNVLTKASSVASHAACKLMECPNLLVGNFASFIELSPYRPFGMYIFCSTDTESIKMVGMENPDTVLQMLFHFSRLSFEAEEEYSQVARHKLMKNLAYENVLQNRLEMQNVVYLASASDKILEDLGLYTRARLCLLAAEESEKQKLRNEENIDKESITKNLKLMQQYRMYCERRKVWYYDAFKIQDSENDFLANVARLELAGIWDVIVDMLKNYQLPDSFEGKQEWIDLGTEFRRLSEPLDVANYYRHGRNDDAGPYMTKGRPRRYKLPQRWHDHNKRMMQVEALSESCFLGEVEELRNLSKKKSNIDEDMKKRIMLLEGQVLQWHQAKVLGEDVFLDKSTFTLWWNSLPPEHKRESCIKELFEGTN